MIWPSERSDPKAVYSAPGKLMLLGEYGVLEGGRAMACAVNRRAIGLLNDAAPPPTPVIEAVLRLAEGAGYPRIGSLVSVDTRAFSDGRGLKLGLGSSSAVAVITAALATGSDDENTLDLAARAHRLATGGGSGVDVAACFSGGVIASSAQPAIITPLPSRIKGLELAVLYSGEPASTGELIKAAKAAPRWKDHAASFASLAEEGIQAWSYQQSDRFLSAVARAGRAYETLGREIGKPVVTEVMAAIMRYAGEANAAAKPSGAGGGDVMILFSRDPALADEIAEKTGARRVALAIDPAGLKREKAQNL